MRKLLRPEQGGGYTYRGMTVEKDHMSRNLVCSKLVNGEVFKYVIPEMELERVMDSRTLDSTHLEMMLERASRMIDDRIRMTNVTALEYASKYRQQERPMALGYYDTGTTATTTTQRDYTTWTNSLTNIARTMMPDLPVKKAKDRITIGNPWNSKDSPLDILRRLNHLRVRNVRL